MKESLERGRASFHRRDWTQARAELDDADRDSALQPEDLAMLATAAYLGGDTEAAVLAWSRAHRDALDRADPDLAARYGFWVGFVLMNAGEMAQAGAWVARERNLLDEVGSESSLPGLLMLPEAVGFLHGQQYEAADRLFVSAAEVGTRCRDLDLQTLAQLGHGQSLLGLGRAVEGMAVLDEAMLLVTAGEVSPQVAGLVFCAVIEACHAVFDIRRAQEWTGALTRWCGAQPGLVLYHGQCSVHRAQLLQLHGDWAQARDETHEAVRRLSEPPGQYAVGDAFYLLGELHRVAGEFAEAEAAYRCANEVGRSPQPGLALLRMAQGRSGTALASLRRLLDDGHEALTQFELLAAFVEVALEEGELSAARAAADQLAESASGLDVPFLLALSACAEGAVLLSEGDARGAGAALRTASSIWRDLDAPHDAARVRVMLGLACSQLGDREGAELEFEAARAIFERLGAVTDLARLVVLTTGTASLPAGLTARELEVLRLVAAGGTNRQIADELVISEKTVARHVSNMFVKLNVSSRAAATAYAYEHDLVVPA